MLKDYEIIKTLGKGSYGKVFQAKRKLDGFLCVLKKVSLEGLSDIERRDALNEVCSLISFEFYVFSVQSQVMNRVKHFHVIQYYESFIEDNLLVIVMEFAAGGDLAQKLKHQLE